MSQPPKNTAASARKWFYGNYVSAFKGRRGLGLRVAAAGNDRMISYYQAKLSPWLVDYPASARMADLGCGSGLLLDTLRAMGFQNLEGIDLSPEQVGLAKKRHPNVRQGDMLKFLKRSRNRFDLLLCFDVVEHLRRDELLTFFHLAHRALLPGGGLILQTPNGDAPLAGPVIYGDLTHESILTPSSLSHLLAGAGFPPPQMQEHDPDFSRLPGAVRWLFWQILRAIYTGLHLIETGSTPSPVFSRVFRAYSKKQG